jgi:hypothetical protein
MEDRWEVAALTIREELELRELPPEIVVAAEIAASVAETAIAIDDAVIDRGVQKGGEGDAPRSEKGQSGTGVEVLLGPVRPEAQAEQCDHGNEAKGNRNCTTNGVQV